MLSQAIVRVSVARPTTFNLEYKRPAQERTHEDQSSEQAKAREREINGYWFTSVVDFQKKFSRPTIPIQVDR